MSVSFVPLSTTGLLLQSWSSPETHYTLINFITGKVNNTVNMRKEYLKSASNFTPMDFFLKKTSVGDLFYYFFSIFMTPYEVLLTSVNYSICFISYSPYHLYWHDLPSETCTKVGSYFPFSVKIFPKFKVIASSVTVMASQYYNQTYQC